MEKIAKAEELRVLKEAARVRKAAAKEAREVRDKAVSHYIKAYGVTKARFIIACIEKKKRGDWIYTKEDGIRAKKWSNEYEPSTECGSP